ncbi:MAG: NAD(P)-binding protein [Myxococcales bacterium]|nr:NAD(P)-binding protein [Myxococcales bacterium]MCB9641492.1 NAD(P)-binding protein [Myxococcales bacterium]
MEQRRKIAILGGGVGSMAAAWALSSEPGWSERYDITLYQLGWRLGGKGASGRDRTLGQRIEEHGLHVWGGFYENAFRMIREVYGALKRPIDMPLATWQDAFHPSPDVLNAEVVGTGDERHWTYLYLLFPPRDGEPGDPGWTPPTIRDVFETGLAWMEEIFLGKIPLQVIRKPAFGPEVAADAHYPQGEGFVGTPADGGPSTSAGHGKMPSWWPEEIGRGGWLGFVRLGEELGSLRTEMKRWPTDIELSRDQWEPTTRRLASIRDDIRQWAQTYLVRHDFVRVMLEVAELAIASMIGVLVDGVLLYGWDVIDDQEWSSWLVRHGAPPSIKDALPVRAMYHFSFAYPLGDSQRPSSSAAVMMRILTRMWFAYRGSIFYKMQAGMGDAVFAPLYELLAKRGVKFRFFSKVKDLLPSEDGLYVDEIVIGQQVRLRGEVPEEEAPSKTKSKSKKKTGKKSDKDAKEAAPAEDEAEILALDGDVVYPPVLPGETYRPLYLVHSLPCWPSEPFWSQIEGGAALRKRLKQEGLTLESAWCNEQVGPDIRLKRGQDFDTVIMGLPPASWRLMGTRLVDQKPALARMLSGDQTVETSCLQLWMYPTQESLGWPFPEAVLTGERMPFDTFADMSHLLPHESWHGPEVPQSISYFCGVPVCPAQSPLDDPHYPQRKLATLFQSAAGMLEGWSGRIWPDGGDGTASSGLSWQHLYDRRNEQGEERLKSQYVRVNVDPSERYLLSPPGLLKTRLRGDQTGYLNLFLVGDGTLNGLNYGCVEAAVISGLQVSRSMTGFPREIPGETDGAPRVWSPGVGGSSLPKFVEVQPPESLPPPFVIKNVSLYTFLLESSRPGALQAYVDMTLNRPAQGQVEYRVLFDNVIVYISPMQQVYSKTWGIEAGWTPETDVGFWIAVGASRPGSKKIERILIYPVSMFVDIPYTLVSGRESFGYPKGAGQMQVPMWPGDPGPFTLWTQMEPLHSEQTRNLELWSIHRNGDGPIESLWEDATDALGFLWEFLFGQVARDAGLSMLTALSKDLWPMLGMRMVFLKQFRDAVAPEHACYQSILEGLTSIQRFSGGGVMPGRFQFQIQPTGSADLLKTFGLKAKMDVLLATWVKMDMTVENADRQWVVS